MPGLPKEKELITIMADHRIHRKADIMENFTNTFVNIPKKAAAINDLTGFGRCSLAVVLPVLNAMGLQACPIPTSVFSSHMAFPSYYYRDLSAELSPFLAEYETLQLTFDGIYCGFLNSQQQFAPLERFMERQRKAGSPIILIDPVLGERGRTYRIVTEALCQRMKHFISRATIITPNLTEACLLTDTAFPDPSADDAFLQMLTEKLLAMGPVKTVITGIEQGSRIRTYCGERNGNTLSTFSCDVISNGESRPGTGDLFAAILIADAVNHVPFAVSVRKAADFVRICVEQSALARVPIREGVIFENRLSVLWDENNG